MAAADAEPIQSLRQAIMDHIRDEPGASIQELADRAGVGRTAAVHHVRRLQRDGRIERVRKGRRVHHFPRNVRQPIHQSLLATVRLANARTILQALHDDPTLSWRSLAVRLEITPKAVRWHVKEMEAEGMLRVTRSGSGQQHCVHFHPHLAAWLAGQHPGPPMSNSPIATRPTDDENDRELTPIHMLLGQDP